MKKIKQILAIIGVIILVSLYASTLVCALSGSDNFMDLLMASIYATVVIPVLLWAYTLVYRLVKKNSDEEDSFHESSSNIDSSVESSSDKDSSDKDSSNKNSSTENSSK